MNSIRHLTNVRRFWTGPFLYLCSRKLGIKQKIKKKIVIKNILIRKIKFYLLNYIYIYLHIKTTILIFFNYVFYYKAKKSWLLNVWMSMFIIINKLMKKTNSCNFYVGEERRPLSIQGAISFVFVFAFFTKEYCPHSEESLMPTFTIIILN